MKKISFESLLDNMSYFLNFPEVENNIEKLILEEAEQSILTETRNGSRPAEDVLADYLRDDKNQKKLKMMISMAGGSEEKLKRIVASIFDGSSINEIRKDSKIRERVAKFLVNPASEPSFIPMFVRKSFSLPNNWIELLKDKEYMSVVARHSMSAKYAARMGFELERQIANIVTECGYTSEKGAVQLVDDKEVDLAVPNVRFPQIIVMVSYQLTTGSGQSSKANEQSQMYNAVQKYSRSRVGKSVSMANPNATRGCIFVNVIDGGGWIERRSDLEQLWHHCDYCFTFNTIGDFRMLLDHVMNK